MAIASLHCSRCPHEEDLESWYGEFLCPRCFAAETACLVCGARSCPPGLTPLCLNHKGLAQDSIAEAQRSYLERSARQLVDEQALRHDGGHVALLACVPPPPGQEPTQHRERLLAWAQRWLGARDTLGRMWSWSDALGELAALLKVRCLYPGVIGHLYGSQAAAVRHMATLSRFGARDELEACGLFLDRADWQAPTRHPLHRLQVALSAARRRLPPVARALLACRRRPVGMVARIAAAVAIAVATALLVIRPWSHDRPRVVVLDDPPALRGAQVARGVGVNDSPFRCPDPELIKAIVALDHGSLKLRWRSSAPVRFDGQLDETSVVVEIPGFVEQPECRPRIELTVIAGDTAGVAAVQRALREALARSTSP
ncbi:MAG TPA: hypothetical protein VNO30_20605 [Kofleriaceae bacterium]|nr:hypothetical protein [Kofleriaceae bacterium]